MRMRPPDAEEATMVLSQFPARAEVRADVRAALVEQLAALPHAAAAHQVDT